jgi:hypothetical protein
MLRKGQGATKDRTAHRQNREILVKLTPTPSQSSILISLNSLSRKRQPSVEYIRLAISSTHAIHALPYDCLRWPEEKV